jgi:hypothetical protein
MSGHMPNYGKKVLADLRSEVKSRTKEGTADFSNPEDLKILGQILDEREAELLEEGRTFARDTIIEHLLKDEIETLKKAPVELDTRIITRKITTLQYIPCKHEYWTWDGVYAESLIFLKCHVGHLKEDELLRLCEPYFENESSKKTIKASGNYVYVNFNFRTS